MTQKLLTHHIDVKRVWELFEEWDITPAQKKDVKKFFDDYQSGHVTKRLGTNNPASLERNLCSLRPALENLKGYSKEELKKFLGDLIKDKIKSKRGEPYSLRSKKEIINILKRFVKWKGKDSTPLDLIIGTKDKEPPSLTEEEIKKLIDGCNNLKYKYFIVMLYSTGARAEEFHNIRSSDIEFPSKKTKENNIRVMLRKEFSKTHGRRIPLLYKPCLDIIRDYVSLRIEEGMNPEDIIFPIKYVSMRKWLNRHGKKVLGKPINYHLFRHARASHLNKDFNRQQMSVFFGWDFTSKMLDIYCNRDVDFKIVEEKFDNTEIEELREQLEAYGKIIKDIGASNKRQQLLIKELMNKNE